VIPGTGEILIFGAVCFGAGLLIGWLI